MEKETASQLFARLGAVGHGLKLNDDIFTKIPNGIQPGDIAEICGAEGSGKTEILYAVIANVITNFDFETLEKGIEPRVIFIDTEHKFSVLRLVRIIEHKLESEINNDIIKDSVGVSSIRNKRKHGDIDTFIQAALKGLLIYQCFSSQELGETLLSIETLLYHHPEVSILMIDTISAYFNVDKLLGLGKMQQELQQRHNTELISKITANHQVIVLATKSLLFHGKDSSSKKMGSSNSYQNIASGHQEFMSQEWQSKVRYRMLISDKTNNIVTNNERLLFVIKPVDFIKDPVRFTITKDGIELG